ncbi:MAG: hypothetical protein Q7R93_01805 [bacterium]|nr:hypothetical protein [bacterium]
MYPFAEHVVEVPSAKEKVGVKRNPKIKKMPSFLIVIPAEAGIQK